MDWNNPEDRLRLIEKVGSDEYSRQMRAKLEREVIERVNGRAIRKTSSRFGVIYWVSGTDKGHSTLEGAREIARQAGPL